MIDYNAKNFVAPAATPPQTLQQQQQVQQPATALAVTRVAPIQGKQLLDSFNTLAGVYQQQYKQAAKSGEIVTDNDQSVSYRLSTASELVERRKTARMYILFLCCVVASVTTGVVLLAHVAHITSDAGQSIAMWLILFGAVQSVLTWRHLQREQRLSPEGLHHEQIRYDAQVNMMDAQTRRAAVDFMGRTELERVRLQQSQADAQREAGRRLALEAQAKVAQQMVRHTTPQSNLNRLNTYRPTAQSVPQRRQETPQATVAPIPAWYDLEPVVEATEGVEAVDTLEAMDVVETADPIVDPVRQRLLDFVADLYLDYSVDGEGHKTYNKIHADGRLKKGVIVPWAYRSDLTKAQRDQVEGILRQITPSLFEYDETRKQWALNVAAYRKVHHAIAAIDAAFTLV